jgi:hypothetical protein
VGTFSCINPLETMRDASTSPGKDSKGKIYNDIVLSSQSLRETTCYPIYANLTTSESAIGRITRDKTPISSQMSVLLALCLHAPRRPGFQTLARKPIRQEAPWTPPLAHSSVTEGFT